MSVEFVRPKGLMQLVRDPVYRRRVSPFASNFV